MTLDLVAVPLAFAAGGLSILSPCVWPLVPVVMSSAGSAGRRGPIALALGLSLSFALAGTLLSFVLLNLGLDPVLFRYVAALLLVVMGVLLLSKAAADGLALKLSTLTARFNLPQDLGDGAPAQFGLGLLLGLVWLPCVGPTLGAAIALASLGEHMLLAFVVMLSFGIGTAAVLLLAGALSQALLQRLRPGTLAGAGAAKRLMGILVLSLGVLVLTGVDKMLETWALTWLPDWALSF